MLTALILLWPTVAAALVFLTKGPAAKKVAFGATLIEFALVMLAMFQFTVNAKTQFELNLPWIEQAGIGFHIGMDGISLLMVFLTAFLTPLIVLSAFGNQYNNPGRFYGLILLMQTGLTGVFVSLDAFLFYFFWEMALIPIWLIAGIWGGDRRIAVTFKFFIYTIAGSLFMLAGFLYIYFQTGSVMASGMLSSDISAFYKVALDSDTQSWLFWFLFVAFAIKMPIFPFHTWQPDTYTESPTQGTMLLSGIMLKMGIYGVIRWLLPVVPMGVSRWDEVVLVLALIGIIYGSIIAIRQQDLKRLIAFSSLAHVGLIAAGIFTLNEQGLQGGMIQMLSHGINVVGLFFVAEIIFRRTDTRHIVNLGGITQSAPALSIIFMVLMLSAVALPLTSGFVGEFLLLMGVYKYNAWMGAVAGLTIILSAVYMFRMFQGAMFGEKTRLTQTFTDLTFTEKAVLIPLVVMVFWIGLHPNTFLNLTEPAVINLLNIINR